MLDTVGNAINDVWSDATSLLDYADNEAQTPVENYKALATKSTTAQFSSPKTATPSVKSPKPTA
ncbi:hypothetical protein BSPWISOXPB_423 [uncultured Gammaproteobacteria bacterium]|nr:hypothetical protein BSPWISOXPB_423 [uncultured Gammaproteobacteria bacterium]